NPFFDLALDIAAHQALDHQQQNHAAIENWNGKEIEDAQVDADERSQKHQRQPAFFAECIAGSLPNAYRARDLLDRDFLLNQFFHHHHDQAGELLVLLNRFTERFWKRKLIYVVKLAQADAVALFAANL